MKILRHPVLTTILLGLVCGISFIPLNLVLNRFFLRSSAICLMIWLCSVGYAIVLGRWSNNKIRPVLFPLLFLLLAVFLVKSIGACFILALAMISWIRSGICFPEYRGLKLAIELLLCVLGGVLINVFMPRSELGWALGIWLFFLIQALYFVVFDSKAIAIEEKIDLAIDPFERASRLAADILSAGGKLTGL